MPREGAYLGVHVYRESLPLGMHLSPSTDRRLWKHYLPPTSFTSGKKPNRLCSQNRNPNPIQQQISLTRIAIETGHCIDFRGQTCLLVFSLYICTFEFSNLRNTKLTIWQTFCITGTLDYAIWSAVLNSLFFRHRWQNGRCSGNDEFPWNSHERRNFYRGPERQRFSSI